MSRHRRATVGRSILRRHRLLLAWCLPASLISDGVELLLPVALGAVVERGIVAGDLPLTLLGAGGIVLARTIGVSLWCAVFTALQQARMAERHRLRVAVTAALLEPGSTVARRPAGEILAITTSDADNASDILEVLHAVVPGTVVVVAGCVWFTVLDPWLGVVLAVGLLALVAVVQGITPALSHRFADQQTVVARAAATATDLVRGLRTLQALGAQTPAKARYRRRSREALQASLRNARLSGVAGGATLFVSTAMLGAVVVLACLHTLAGAMGVGTLIAVAGVARTVMGRLQNLSGVPVRLAGVRTSGARLSRLTADLGRCLDDPALAIDPADPGRGRHLPRPAPRGRQPAGRRPRNRPPVTVGSVHLRDVVHGSLTGIDLDVVAGEMVGIAYVDPCDADAMTDLLLHGPASGPAWVGERATPDATLPRQRANVLVEPHDVHLVDGTLRDQVNLDPGTAGSDRRIAAALDAAGAADLLDVLPDGLETRITDQGSNLSGGQMQRIALARAVAADRPVLVLRDPTTALDALTEQRVAQNLAAVRRRPDRATVLLTRSPALLEACTRVILLQDGRVTAEGTHESLLKRRDYRGLVVR